MADGGGGGRRRRRRGMVERRGYINWVRRLGGEGAGVGDSCNVGRPLLWSHALTVSLPLRFQKNLEIYQG